MLTPGTSLILPFIQRKLNPISFEIGACNYRARLPSANNQIYKGRGVSIFFLSNVRHLNDSHKKSCLLLTLHYVDQICARMPLFTLSSLTCHRFIIASITVCSKGLCDTFCTNSLYARVGGIPVSELNVLEREFLAMIDWRLTVSTFSLTQLSSQPRHPLPLPDISIPPSSFKVSQHLTRS